MPCLLRDWLIRATVLYLSLGCLIAVDAAYVPGTFRREFEQGETIGVEVNSVTSFETHLPHDYYSLPFCQPKGGIKESTTSVNLGTILSGLRIYNSPYEFRVNDLKQKIDERYRIRLALDNMPITRYDLDQAEGSSLRPGFELGARAGEDYVIFNHLAFNVLIHRTHAEATQPAHESAPEGDAADGAADATATGVYVDSADGALPPTVQVQGPEDMWEIVGFEVLPCSIERVPGEPLDNNLCKPWGERGNPKPQVVAEGQDIVYTYDVYWQESGIQWADRWDAYVREADDVAEVHWLSIINSMVSLLILSGIVTIVLIRTLRHGAVKSEKHLLWGWASKESSAWKLISGDVFRAPSSAADLSVQVGTGAQIFCTAVVTLLLAAAGFLSPASRGALLTSAIFLYPLLAMPAGYAAVWLWCNTQRTAAGWTSICLKTACYFPGVTLAVAATLNVFITYSSTSIAVPFTTYAHITALYLCVNVPLTFLGGYLATRTPLATWPTRTNQTPRDVPPPPRISMRPWVLYVYLPTMHGLSVLLYVCYIAIAILATHLCLGAVGFAASLAFVRLVYSRLEATGRGGKGASEEGEQLLPGHAAAAAEKQGAGEGDAQAGSVPV